jgi:hypothetical protein
MRENLTYGLMRGCRRRDDGESKRARSRKRRIQPRGCLHITAPVFYSTPLCLQITLDRGPQATYLGVQVPDDVADIRVPDDLAFIIYYLRNRI